MERSMMKLSTIKVGILCASDSELAPFLPQIADCVATQKAMLTFYQGKIAGVDVVALYSGVCKVNAAIAAQLLIDLFGCGAIINAGTAGGMDAQLKLFDTVIASKSAYHDVADDILTDFHPWLDSIWFSSDEALLSLAGEVMGSLPASRRCLVGRVVTGEQFIVDENRDAINARLAPLSTDMETAAVAHVCHVNAVPFLAVRTITDTATHSGLDTFEANCEHASVLSADFVCKLLARMQ